MTGSWGYSRVGLSLLAEQLPVVFTEPLDVSVIHEILLPSFTTQESPSPENEMANLLKIEAYP